MNRIPEIIRACALAIGTALIVTACTQQEFRPVHDEVTWEGENNGQHEDDPRVQVLREYLVQRYAADNALNYSSPKFRDTVTESSRSGVISAARHAADGPDLRVWEGPPSFSVIKVQPFGDDGAFQVNGCEQYSPWWSMSAQLAKPDDVIKNKDETFFVRPQKFHERTYKLIKQEGSWQVDSGTIGSNNCEPQAGSAIGAFVTPPDLELLRTATSESVIVLDHRGHGDS